MNKTADNVCTKHGAFGLAGRQWIARCPECFREAEQAAVKRERRNELVRESCLVGRFKTATFDTFQCSSAAQRKVLAACREYVAELDPRVWRGLWLIGPPGTGKTHLGAAMVSAAIDRDIGGVMLTARDIVRELRATWKRDATESEDDVIQFYGTRPLLVIDEIGVGFGSEAEQLQLFDIVDMRYQLRRPTVVVSNLSVAKVRAVLGERLFDRLREGATVHVCDWKSARAWGSDEQQGGA